jgi:hypothetical protein
MNVKSKFQVLEKHPDYLAYVVIGVCLLINGLYQTGVLTGHILFYLLQK